MTAMRDMDLFVAVAEARSFRVAAASLALPPSTLSRRIARLERELGLPLFTRTTRSVALTEAGERYLARSRAIVDAAEEARREVHGLAETPQGVLRMSMEAEVVPAIVGPVIAEYLARYAGVQIELDLSPRRMDLVADQFDIALRIGKLPDSTLIVRQVATLAASLYAAPDYLARRGVPDHPDDLGAHARIHLLHVGDRGEWQLSRDGCTVEVAAGSLVTANNMGVIRHLTRLGIGIGVVDDMLARDDVAAGHLVRVLPEWQLPPAALSALTASRLLPAKSRLFLDMLTAHLTVSRSHSAGATAGDNAPAVAIV